MLVISKTLFDFLKTILRLLLVFDILVASCYVIRILGGALYQTTNTVNIFFSKLNFFLLNNEHYQRLFRISKT